MTAAKLIAATAVAGLAVLYCAGPLLLATIGSVVISASVLTGSLVIAAGAAGIAWLASGPIVLRSADPNAVDCGALESAKRKSNT